MRGNMPRERKRARRWQYIVWITLIAPLLLYLVSFLGDFGQVLSYIWQVFYWMLFGRNLSIPLPDPAVVRSFQVVLFTIFLGYGLTFLIWLLLMSFQALLPVETLDEVYETMSHQIMYLMRTHGPAIFVLDGKMDYSAGELNRSGPGVIVVNFNSAIVLEKMVGRGSCLMAPSYLMRRFMNWMAKAPPGPKSRVAGPGVVFTIGNERIRAVVDLRKQSRDLKTPINAYTRDGIEVNSKVFAVFTIGQRPDVIELAYQGDRREENLKIISTRQVGGNLIEVRTLPDEELDPADLLEAHNYARIPNQNRDAQAYTEVERPRHEPEFDSQRVFNAVYAQARNPQEQVVPWTELPVQVAADLFRSLMPLHNYNDLYALNDPAGDSFPIPEIRRHFRVRLRNTGLLWYRIVFHRSLMPLMDGTYNASDLFVSPYLAFTGSQVLRDRGIKVLEAGFSSPLPASPEVYQQRLAHWRAEWEHDTTLIRSQYELEATRIRNHARAQAQHDLTQALRQIFERGAGSDEVMALRVFQALEGVAADPKTRQLLPNETIALMNNLHNWLLPGDAGKAGAAGLLSSQAPSSSPASPPSLPPNFIPPADVPPPPPADPGE
jgi:hypothetical protein